MKINLYNIANNSVEIFYKLRWNGCICCPHCGSVHVYNPEAGQLHICADCHAHFSDTSGTIFHCTKLPLSKWLYAIYLFVQTSRGISSYALARMIEVSQPTAWKMLMKIRQVLDTDFEMSDELIMDEVFLGGDWSRVPSFKKYQLATPPKVHWNLTDPERKAYYKSEFMRLASEHKMPVLGICSFRERKIQLLSFPTSDRKEFVRECLNSILGAHDNFDNTPMIITDQGSCYKFLNEDENYNHQVCRHDQNKYASQDGISSNKIESNFAHLKRMWRGTYQMWSRKYNQDYLNEYAWRYTYRELPVEERFKKIFYSIDNRKSA